MNNTISDIAWFVIHNYVIGVTVPIGAVIVTIDGKTIYLIAPNGVTEHKVATLISAIARRIRLKSVTLYFQRRNTTKDSIVMMSEVFVRHGTVLYQYLEVPISRALERKPPKVEFTHRPHKHHFTMLPSKILTPSMSFNAIKKMLVEAGFEVITETQMRNGKLFIQIN